MPFANSVCDTKYHKRCSTTGAKLPSTSNLVSGGPGHTNLVRGWGTNKLAAREVQREPMCLLQSGAHRPWVDPL